MTFGEVVEVAVEARHIGRAAEEAVVKPHDLRGGAPEVEFQLAVQEQQRLDGGERIYAALAATCHRPGGGIHRQGVVMDESRVHGGVGP